MMAFKSKNYNESSLHLSANKNVLVGAKDSINSLTIGEKDIQMSGRL